MFAGQRCPALDVERLVDRLVRDPHRRVVREVAPQPGRDLLRAPRLCPPPVGASSPVAAGERHRWPGHRDAVLGDHSAGQAFLHVSAQSGIADHFRLFRAGGAAVAVPLRYGRPVGQYSAAGARVTPQFPGHRRRGPTQLSSDLSDALLLGMP